MATGGLSLFHPPGGVYLSVAVGDFFVCHLSDWGLLSDGVYVVIHLSPHS